MMAWPASACVGQKVVMVSEFIEAADVGQRAPILGCVYTIRLIEYDVGEVWFLFEEIRNPPFCFVQDGQDCIGETIFAGFRFRPVDLAVEKSNTSNAVEKLKRAALDVPHLDEVNP